MNQKIFVACDHPGGANAISPVASEIIRDGGEVVVLEYGAVNNFGQYGFQLTPLSRFGIVTPEKENLEIMLGKENAGLVITGASVQKPGSIEHLAIKAARNVCPSLSVLDLWMNYSPRFKDETENFVLPDAIAIMDEIARKGMEAEGFPPEILKVTGNPYFDSLHSCVRDFDAEKRIELRKKLGINPGEILVSFYSQPIEQDWGRNGGKYGFTEQDVKARHLALSSDVTATAFSTSAYESIAMGVPAIAIMPGATDSVIIDTFIPVFGEYIPIAKDSKRIYDLIKSLVYDRGYKAKVNKILSKVIVDGK